MLSPKVALLFGAGAGTTVYMVEAAVGAGLTGNPLLDGLLGGAGVTLLTIGIYKGKVDRLVADVATKADAHDVKLLREDVAYIRQVVDHLRDRP